MSKVERLVNLTVALLETRRPMPLAELKRRTGYYDQDDEGTARRMFERDKDELRRMGVPIETHPLPFSEEIGYLVPRDAYELPDLDLSADEVAALALAVRLTGAGSTPLALAKLAARAPDPSEAPRTTTRVELATDPVEAVAASVLTRTAVRFGYRAADGTVSTRTLDPYGVARRRAAWYLVGRDHDRDALRSFRLDRMTEPPVEVGDPSAYTLPDDFDVAALLDGPQATEEPIELAVDDTARWSVEVRGGRDTGRTHGVRAVYEVPSSNPLRDRSWILGLADSVTVLAPDELRAAVVAALQRLVGEVA